MDQKVSVHSQNSIKIHDVSYEENEEAVFSFSTNLLSLSLSLPLSLSPELNDMEHQLVGPEIIDTALRVCQEFLSVLNHSDIDVTAGTPPSVEEKQWHTFLQDYYMVVQ